jgi:pimeloyl-ACP methyl ester carboxylesterase
VIRTVPSYDGVPVTCEVHGAGAPILVFVHGWSCDRSYWKGQLEPLSHRFQVMAVDLGGHGESGLGRPFWTIASFGGDVAAVVEELGASDPVVLIGHSMGGDVILEAARLLRQRVMGLVWVDTRSQLGRLRAPGQVEEFMAPFHADFPATTRDFVRRMFRAGADESLIKWVAGDMAAAPPGVALSALGASLAYDREVLPALQNLNVPLVAINADYQSTNIESMNKHGVEVVLMPDSGHFLMMEDPGRFNGLLAGVIDGLVRGASR